MRNTVPIVEDDTRIPNRVNCTQSAPDAPPRLLMMVRPVCLLPAAWPQTLVCPLASMRRQYLRKSGKLADRYEHRYTLVLA